jgi:hypothetical protein
VPAFELADTHDIGSIAAAALDHYERKPADNDLDADPKSGTSIVDEAHDLDRAASR